MKKFGVWGKELGSNAMLDDKQNPAISSLADNLIRQTISYRDAIPSPNIFLSLPELLSTVPARKTFPCRKFGGARGREEADDSGTLYIEHP